MYKKACKFVFLGGGGGGGEKGGNLNLLFFLKFSLTSPSSLLKVPIYSYCFQRMKIIVSVLVRVQQTSLGLARGEQSYDSHHLSFICATVIIQMKTTW